MSKYLRKIPTLGSSTPVFNAKDSRVTGTENTQSQFVIRGIHKRALDVAASSVAVVLLAPLLATIAITVKICDGGPVLFRHRRIGCGGRTFECLKFRTMKVDAEARLQEWLLQNPLAADEWNATQKLRNDPRLTAVGKSLRRSSIDELPQLFNILRGDMSLVGPRPVVAEEVPRYGRDIAHYYSVRPGLTGAWQVSGRNDLSYAERVRLDAEYCTTWSFTKDLVIMLKTVPVLFSGRGSY